MYKVTSFIWNLNTETRINVREYVTIDSNLTWQEAKEMRKANRSLFIVKQ